MNEDILRIPAEKNKKNPRFIKKMKKLTIKIDRY